MKKITSLIVVVLTITALQAQTSFKWNGGQTDQLWDYVTPNWLDPNSILPFPKTFLENSSALFDDTSVETSDTIKIVGEIKAVDVTFNATKTYVVRSTATTDLISGTGTLIKDGTGLLVMDAKSTLAGGTILRKGKMMMEKQTTPNIFGAKLVFEGDAIANFATTSSGSYPSISVPIEIKNGVTAKVETSRYSYFASPITGSGNLIIAAGGERTMMGTNKAGGVAVDWNQFTGNVTFEPYKMSGVTPGYYAMLLAVTRTFNYELVQKPDSMFATVDTLFKNRKVTLKAGVGLTGASGTRCYAIGELNAEDETAFLGGYGAAKSTTPRVYYMIGSSNTDVICPVSFKDVGGSGYNWVGVIKVGTGTYTFNSTQSITTASMGVQVAQGTFYVNTPISDGITSLGRVRSGNSLTINKNAIGGGNGRLTGKVQVDSLGTLVVGYKESIGMLALNDTLGGNTTASPLVVKNGGKMVFKLGSTQSYDKLTTNSTATLNGCTILLKPAIGFSIADGDKFTILSAQARVAVADSFKIETEGFPATVTFTAAADTVGGGFRIVVTAQGSATALKNVNAQSVRVFPNPVRDELRISAVDAEINSVQLVNLQGQVVVSKAVNAFNFAMSVAELPKGIYFARIKAGKDLITQKIILQ